MKTILLCSFLLISFVSFSQVSGFIQVPAETSKDTLQGIVYRAKFSSSLYPQVSYYRNVYKCDSLIFNYLKLSLSKQNPDAVVYNDTSMNFILRKSKSIQFDCAVYHKGLLYEVFMDKTKYVDYVSSVLPSIIDDLHFGK